MTSHEYILSLTKNIVPSYRYDYNEDFFELYEQDWEDYINLIELQINSLYKIHSQVLEN